MAQKSVVRTDRAPSPFRGAPYSQAIRIGELVFVSGQLAVKPGTSEIAGSTIQEQTEQIFSNLGAILEAAGSGLARLKDVPGMNEVYRRHAGEMPPARSTVGGCALPQGALVEIEAIGHV
ncbi:MAG: Rid family hydrolase [Gemmatimonadales bacterium]|nr:Rid family hydrolase [Gemmatimonadales bacterium]